MVEPLLQKAEDAFRGLLILPGSGKEPVFVGDPPDWHFDPFDDDQTTSTLNRTFHWVTMVRAWRVGGEVKFALRVVEELKDWIEKCPCPLPPDGDHTSYDYRGPGPWRLLDAGIRMMESWVPPILILRDAGFLDDTMYRRVLKVCDDHARVLACCVPIDSRPLSNNHLLMEMLGLLYTAVALPVTERSESDRQLAIDELCRAAREQVTPEGAQVEGCPHYHNLVLALISHASALLRGFEIEVPESFTAAVRNMTDYSLHATRPSGVSVPWGIPTRLGPHGTRHAGRWSRPVTIWRFGVFRVGVGSKPASGSWPKGYGTCPWKIAHKRCGRSKLLPPNHPTSFPGCGTGRRLSKPRCGPTGRHKPGTCLWVATAGQLPRQHGTLLLQAGTLGTGGTDPRLGLGTVRLAALAR